VNARGPQIEFENAMAIDIIGQGATIGLEDFSGQQEMFPGALHFPEGKAGYQTGVIVCGHKEIMVAAAEGKPDMTGGVMLEQSSNGVHLKSNPDFLTLFGCLLVITFLDGEATDGIAMDNQLEPFSYEFRQVRKVEFAPIVTGFLPNVEKLLTEKILHLLGQRALLILPRTAELERSLADLSLEPPLAQLIELNPFYPQELAGFRFG